MCIVYPIFRNLSQFLLIITLVLTSYRRLFLHVDFYKVFGSGGSSYEVSGPGLTCQFGKT